VTLGAHQKEICRIICFASIEMRTKYLVFVVCCLAPLISRAQIPVGSNQLDFNLGSTKIHAFTYKAPSYSYGCLIIAFHGDNRHPEWTRDARFR